MGEDTPRPGMSVFQSTFLVVLNSVGIEEPVGAMLVPEGPRHTGQS